MESVQPYIALAVPLLIVLAVVISYNRFVNQRNVIRNSWSNIDTELQRRYDLIPNLVETVRSYAEHERDVLEAVTAARAQAVATTGPPSRQAAAEAPLVAELRRLFAVVEGYPELKASRNFLALQDELAVTEDRIQAARRFYNANVAEYNRRVESIPSNLIARVGGFSHAQYFQIDRAVEADVRRPPASKFGTAPG